MRPKLRIIHDRKKQATNTVPALVQIEVYHKDKKKYISAGVKVRLHEWDDVNKRVKGTINEYNDNFYITNLCRKIEDFIIDCERKNEPFSLEALSYVLSENLHGNLSFLNFILDKLSRRKIEFVTHKKLMSLYNHVERFGRLKTFADLTPSNIKEFDYYLNERGLSKVSVFGRHNQLKSFINEAVSEGLIKKSPYDMLKFQRGKSKDPVFLLENELKLIKDLTPINEKLERVKDLFLFQCFTGLSYGDLATFTKDDIRELDDKKIISSNRSKTSESFISLLLPEAENILIKYDYRLPVISNAKYNDYLKVLASHAGINKYLTSHVGRHTFATYLLNKGISITTVARALGHSKLDMTQHYARLLGKTIISEMSSLLN